MSSPVFPDKSTMPTSSVLDATLGQAASWFNDLLAFISKQTGNVNTEWKYYGKKSGWTLKVLSGKRNIFFLIPGENNFSASFTFGEKAREAALTGELSPALRQSVLEAVQYAEGYTFQWSARSREEADEIRKLINIKLEH